MRARLFFWEFNLDIEAQLVFLFMTVDKFQDNPELILERLNIGKDVLDQAIQNLLKWGLLEIKDNTYEVHDEIVHMSEDSPAYVPFAMLSRQKAAERLSSRTGNKSANYFFSALFSTDEKFQSSFKKKLLNLIKEAQNEAINAPIEDVYQLNIDFIKWS